MEEFIRLAVDLHSPPKIYVHEDFLGELKKSELFVKYGFVTFNVGHHLIEGKDDLIQSISQGCKFPSYFGMNWDALSDCLTDFHWNPAKGYIIVFAKGYKLDSLDNIIFDQIILETQKSWAKDGISFKIVAPQPSLLS